MGKVVRYFVGLGSNLGDRLRHLQSAVAGLIARGMAVVGCSSVYETSPVGVTEQQPLYLNAVVACESARAPEDVLMELLGIEREHGRVRTAPGAARTLDMDILLADDLVCRTARLEVPHPRLHERLFVLTPLRELAAQVVHPVLERTIDALYSACRATSRETVVLYAPPFVVWPGQALTA